MHQENIKLILTFDIVCLTALGFKLTVQLLGLYEIVNALLMESLEIDNEL